MATGQHISGAPAIGWTGSTVIIAASNGSTVDYWYQYAGTTPWNEQQVATAAAGTIWGPPTIGWTGSSVIITAVDNYPGENYGDLYYWYQPAGTRPWNEQQVATGVRYSTQFAPSIGWTGSTVIISYTSYAGQVDYWYQPAGTRPWNEQQLPGAGISFYGTAIGWTGSSVIVTAVSSFGAVYYWYEPAGTTTWYEQYVAPDAPQGGEPAIAWTGASVVIAARSGASLEFWWQAAGTQPWHQEQVADIGTSGLAGPSRPSSLTWQYRKPPAAHSRTRPCPAPCTTALAASSCATAVTS